MTNKILWCVRGMAISKAEIVKETEKTYKTGDVEHFQGMACWQKSSFRKGDDERQWFEDRKDALAQQMRNQYQYIQGCEIQLERLQIEIERAKRTLAEWQMNYRNHYGESVPMVDE